MIVDLDSPDARSPARAGAKGSELARLYARGLPVPGGFVITTEAFRRVVAGLDLAARIDEAFRLQEGDIDAGRYALEALSDVVRTAPWPEPFRRALSAALRARGGDASAWAVRSSAIAEDLEGASFAGQYDTVLGVRGEAALEAAVRRCFGSFLNPHALRYKRDRGIHELGAAVVVQALVPAEVAGVCFSAHPITGARDECVIDASWGLGEAVVGGKVTPDTYVVSGDRVRVEAVGDKGVMFPFTEAGAEPVETPAEKRSERCLSDTDASRVAALARRIEAEEGFPVDVEWALAGNALFLLQSRPITTLPNAAAPRAADWRPELDTPIDPRWPMYSRGNISEVLPGVITPLTWSYVGPLIEASFRAQILGFGVMPDPGPEHRVLGFFFHRPYICVSFLAEAAEKTPGLSPDTIYEEFVAPPASSTPPFAARDVSLRGLRAFTRVLTTVATQLRSLHDDAAEHRMRVLEDLRRSDPDSLAALSDAALCDPLRPGPELMAPSITHVWASTAGVTAFSVLRRVTAAWLGDSDSALAAELITGLGGLPSANPAFGLFRLAQRVKQDPALRAAFDEGTDEAPLLERVGDPGGAFGGFAEALSSFLAQHGHRAICEAEFQNPCWREDPDQVLQMVRSYLHDATPDPNAIRARQEHTRAVAEARALDSLRSWQRPLFRRLLFATRRSVALREQMKDVVVLRSDWARRRYRELARRVVARGWLERRDDIFFLLGAEAGALLLGSLEPDAARRIVARRRTDVARCREIEVPKIQEGEARPIGADRDTSHPVGTHAPNDTRVLRGTGVCPGRVEGRARVVLDPRRDCWIEPGEILIAPVTDAGWTPLFVNAAGLVVEVGGLLSHGSVVAREYGLPAIVGVEGATRTIRTGDRLRVDGAAGIVTKIDPHV